MSGRGRLEFEWHGPDEPACPTSRLGAQPRRRRTGVPVPLASISGSPLELASRSGNGAALQAVPAGVLYDSRFKRYAWDGRRLRAVDPADVQRGTSHARTLAGHAQWLLGEARTAFFPRREEVTPDYWEYIKWRASHRFFSSMASIFATQSLLQAVGVGARRALPAAATINWVLKDGLGRLGRLTVATRFGESFDSNLKRFRYSTSLVYASCLGLEYLTPLFPQYFLLLASVANVGKSVGLATFIATQPAFHRSFARSENLAHISAKAQAQQMVVDNLGLALAVTATHVCRNSEAARRALPLAALPFLAAGDLYSIYRELRSVHLRTMNKERAEILAEQWVASRAVLSPREVGDQERMLRAPRIEEGPLPLAICSLEEAVQSPSDLDVLLQQPSSSKFLFTYSPPAGPPAAGSNGGAVWPSWWHLGTLPWARRRQRGSVRVALRSDAAAQDVLLAVLQAACLRCLLLPGGRDGPEAVRSDGNAPRSAADAQRARRDSLRSAADGLGPFLSELGAAGWQTSPFMLSSREKRYYVQLPACDPSKGSG